MRYHMYHITDVQVLLDANYFGDGNAFETFEGTAETKRGTDKWALVARNMPDEE